MAERTGRLLVAFSHPDDESFGVGGTMARLAGEGWQVTVLCATRGEVGEISDPALATPETLGQVREQELRDACAALGVTDVRFLGYRDSGMEGTADNANPRAFHNADLTTAAEQIAAVIREVRPEVVVTWDPSGGYGHPDHVKMHHAATAAFKLTAGEPGGPVALYYTTFDPNLFREMEEEMAKQGIEIGNPQMRERMEQLPRLPATTRIDVAPFVDQKQRATLAHRTQMPPDGFLQRISPELRQRMLARESFHRAAPPWDAKEGELESMFYRGERG